MSIFQELHHVCLVVRDLAKSQAYSESVGIGPWRDYPPLAQLKTLEAPDADAFRALAFKWASLKNVQIQLCQPGPGNTPQRRFLDTHGEGVFHLGFLVPDCDAAETGGKAMGLAVQARGRREDPSGFTYFETPDAAVTLQVRTSPKAK
jgi:methylmalonyl-CoA/ethylmalonyl-CoA epimerase